jgi:hypothetical protein
MQPSAAAAEKTSGHDEKTMGTYGYMWKQYGQPMENLGTLVI